MRSRTRAPTRHLRLQRADLASNKNPRGSPEGREASPGFEPGNDGFANRCLTTWRRGRGRLGGSYRLPGNASTDRKLYRPARTGGFNSIPVSTIRGARQSFPKVRRICGHFSHFAPLTLVVHLLEYKSR